MVTMQTAERPFSPFLVQRLLKPMEGEPAVREFENPGVFEEETNQQLGSLFRLDYMGSAEFEHDNIPRYLRRVWAMCETLRFTATSVTIPRPFIWPDTEKELGVKEEDFQTSLPITVWVIAPVQTMPAMLAWLEEKETTENPDRKQEPAMFSERAYMQAWFALNPDKLPAYHRSTDYVGWWALRENCFYFTDKTMFTAVKGLFAGSRPMMMFEAAYDI